MYEYYNQDGNAVVSLKTIELAKGNKFKPNNNGLNSPFYVKKNTRYYKKDELTEIYLDETCCDNNPVADRNRLYTCVLSELQEWLLTEHKLYVTPMVISLSDAPNLWGFLIKDLRFGCTVYEGNYDFDNMHSAFDAGLYYAMLEYMK